MTPQEIKEIDEVLKELEMEVGWDYLENRIGVLRELEAERAFERSMQDYGPNPAELADRQHKNQLLK